jgi:glycosyltransferase involved in cell wall biosynthesis
MDKLVSVIIPTYNRFEYLKNAIKSVINQTYRPIEIIVINDRSTDDRYYKYNFQLMLTNTNDISLLVFNCQTSSKKELGYSCGALPRNKGISVSKGHYIAFLDDDDIWLPNKLDTQIKKMNLNNSKFCCSDGYIGSGFFNSTIKYPLYLKEYYWNQMKNKLDLNQKYPDYLSLDLIKKHNIIITSSVTITKQLIESVGEMELIPNGGKVINGKRDWQDWNYWRKCLEKEKKCLFIHEPLFYYDMK